MSLDVIPKIHQKTVLGRILDQGQPPNLTKASFFYEFYVVRALEHAGMQDRYMEVLQRWRDMLAKGLSTTPESPDPTRSDTHAWSAHPAFDLPTIIGGIHPAEPGFASVRIEPALSDLQWVRASMPHPGGGIIQVSYERTHNGTHAWITLPGSLKGVLLWKGKAYLLKSGPQEFLLPE